MFHSIFILYNTHSTADIYFIYQVASVDESEMIRSLQRQNDDLRQVIKQMRLEMESLGDQLPATETPRDPDCKFTFSVFQNKLSVLTVELSFSPAV